jgi:outer membrane lipoprotein-sorting protein
MIVRRIGRSVLLFSILLTILVGFGCSNRSRSNEPTWDSIQFERTTKTTTPRMGERTERIIVFQDRERLKRQGPGDEIMLITNGVNYRYNRSDQLAIFRERYSAEYWRAVNYREQLLAQVTEIENKWKREGEEVMGGEHCIRYTKQGKTGWSGERYLFRAWLSSQTRFPRQIESEKGQAHIVTTYSNVVVNAEIPAEEFALPRNRKIISSDAP